MFLQGDDPYFNKLIRILATRCMTQVISFEWLSMVESLLMDTFSKRIYFPCFAI